MAQEVIFIHWNTAEILIKKYRSGSVDPDTDKQRPISKKIERDSPSLEQAIQNRKLVPQEIIDNLTPEEDKIKSRKSTSADRRTWHDVS